MWFKYIDYIIHVIIFFSAAVALTLCQSDPVLNDGQSGSKSSSKTLIDGVRKRFIEKVVSQHEDEQDEYSSD